MPELIDKYEVRLLESDNDAYSGDWNDDYERGFADAINKALELPTIEAEPVIHCKDCAFWESKRVSCEGLARCRTGESGYRCRSEYDFCSRAQRRERVSEDADNSGS